MPVTREERTRRLLEARDAVRATGRRVGGPAPYGWRWDGGSLVPVEAEQRVRWLIRHLHEHGWTLQKIADHLTAIGIRPRSGLNSPWSHSTLYRITRGDAADLQNTG